MAARNDEPLAILHAPALATAGWGPISAYDLQSGETPEQPAPPEAPAPGADPAKKNRADWTLPPHLRETLPLQPKGGRAPRPPASTSAA